MIRPTLSTLPSLSVLGTWAGSVMEVILHLGAHRTASTSFQGYMRANSSALFEQGVGYWGPGRTRDGLLSGVLPVAGEVGSQARLAKAKGRLRLNLERARALGLSQLVISDENMIGAPIQCFRDGLLYHGAGERMARFQDAFDGAITRVSITVRRIDMQWASSIAFLVARGFRIPSEQKVDRIAQNTRTWRDVITDIGCALPRVDFIVQTHDEFCGHPNSSLQHMLNGRITPPKAHMDLWLNRSPDVAGLRSLMRARGSSEDALVQEEGRYCPFSPAQVSKLREDYADDLFWLASGADNIARLITYKGSPQTGKTPQETATRGQEDDQQKGCVA